MATTTAPPTEPQVGSRLLKTHVTTRTRPKLCLGEILSFAYETFISNKVRFALTALGMVIGTASLILVVTIGLTGKQYVMNQIQAIGANLIYAESNPQGWVYIDLLSGTVTGAPAPTPAP